MRDCCPEKPCALHEEEPDTGGCRVPLSNAKAGCRFRVACVQGGRGLCARMAAMGIYPGVEMQLLCSGCGHRCIVRVNGGTLSIGEGISQKILVTPTP